MVAGAVARAFGSNLPNRTRCCWYLLTGCGIVMCGGVPAGRRMASPDRPETAAESGARDGPAASVTRSDPCRIPVMCGRRPARPRPRHRRLPADSG